MRIVSSAVTVLALLVPAALPAQEGLNFYLVKPCRWVDTREDLCEAGSNPWSDILPCPTGALQHGTIRYYNAQEAPLCNDTERPIPLGAKTVVVNVTVVDATAPGRLVLYNATEDTPKVSSINFHSASPRANLVFIPLGQWQGQTPEVPFWPDTAVYAHVPGGSVHLILDLVGYFK